MATAPGVKLYDVLQSIGLDDVPVGSDSVGVGFQHITKVILDNSKFNKGKRMDDPDIPDFSRLTSTASANIFDALSPNRGVNNSIEINAGIAQGTFGTPLNPQFQWNLLDDIRYTADDANSSVNEDQLIKMSGRVYTEIIKRNWSLVHFQLGHDIYNTDIFKFWTDAGGADLGAYIRNEDSAISGLMKAALSLKALAKGALDLLTAGIFTQKFVTFKEHMNLYYEYVDGLLFEMGRQMGLVKASDMNDVNVAAGDNKTAPTIDDGELAENNRYKLKYILGRKDQASTGNGVFAYVPFVLNKSCTVSENWNNSTEEHPLAAQVNEKAMVAQSQRQDMSGGTMPNGLSDIAGKLANFAQDKAQKMVLGQMGTELGSVLAGLGRMALPEVWRDSKFSRSYSLTFKFYAPYGDARTIFENLYVPTLALMAMAVPRQISKQAYMSPFIIRAYAPGLFACDFGMIDSISISKGEDKNQKSVHGIPRTINVTINIKDLMPTFMMSMGKGVFAYLHAKNSQLLDYMWILSGQSLASKEKMFQNFNKAWSNLNEMWAHVSSGDAYVDLWEDSSLYKFGIKVQKGVFENGKAQGSEVNQFAGRPPRSSSH